MNSPEERFSTALHSTARAWRQALNRRLKHLGISQAGWLTIAAIAKDKVAPSQSELADRLGVEGATMVAMIDRLVKSQLLVREPSPTDRRIKRVSLTEAGERLYAQLRAEAEAFRRQILAEIDPETLRSATELLERLQSLAEQQVCGAADQRTSQT
ncbi:MAG: MarR family transcriptional regulator [Gammaproteobacteria bacterium]|nr:MarR family transcriptional regulator [Gammaproteobacteria bacterium]